MKNYEQNTLPWSEPDRQGRRTALVKLGANESSWNPASSTGLRPFWGPCTVLYVMQLNGRVDVEITRHDTPRALTEDRR